MLLRIAERADEQMLYQLAGIQASPRIQELYDLGHESVQLLRAAPDSGQAREHFLAAMGSFGQAGRLLGGDGAPDRDAGSELERLAIYVERLRGISADRGMGVDFGQIDALMALARDQASGTAAGDPIGTLDSLEPLVEAVSAEIRDRSASADEARVREFIEEQLALFEPDAAAVPGAPELVSQARAALSDGRIEEAKERLRQLADLMS